MKLKRHADRRENPSFFHGGRRFFDRALVLPLVAALLGLVVWLQPQPAAAPQNMEPDRDGCRRLLSFYSEPPAVQQFCNRTIYKH